MNMGKSQVLKAVMVGTSMVLAFTACSKAPEKVFSRVASPDGQLEAVLMRCRNADAPSTSALTGAVFTAAGKGCGDVAKVAISSFSVTNAADISDPGATVAWRGGKAIYDVGGDREVLGRQANGKASVDLIQIRGDFEGADIMDEY